MNDFQYKYVLHNIGTYLYKKNFIAYLKFDFN